MDKIKSTLKDIWANKVDLGIGIVWGTIIVACWLGAAVIVLSLMGGC